MIVFNIILLLEMLVGSIMLFAVGFASGIIMAIVMSAWLF